MAILAATKLNCLCWSVEMKHVQKSIFEMTFTFSPVLKRKWMSRHFPLFVLHGWIWFQQRPTLASALKDKENWQNSVALCGTYVVFWYMFLMNACDADSFSLIGCDNLGESVGCIACTLWLDFRNLQASPQFLRDEPPTRKTAYKPRVAVIIHQDLACTRFSNQLLVLVLQLVLIMYASQELTRPCTEAEETRGNYLLFPVLWIAFCTLA